MPRTVQQAVDEFKKQGFTGEEIKEQFKEEYGKDITDFSADDDYDAITAKLTAEKGLSAKEKEVSSKGIQYESTNDKTKQIQKHLCDLSGEYEKMLRHGHASYGGTYSEWSNPQDGRYGPRTNTALRAFFKIEKGRERPANAPITESEVQEILSTTKSKMTAAAAKKVAPAGVTAESKNSTLKIIKNRHDLVENLVFERLVRGCK